MSYFFYLDGSCGEPGVTVIDDSCDVDVFIPGPPGAAGPPIVDLGTRASPIQITTAIPAQTSQRERIFIVGEGGPVTDPTFTNGSGTQELWLFATNNTNTVTLNGQSNLLLSGQWIGVEGSILGLVWDGSSQYVETFRNEI